VPNRKTNGGKAMLEELIGERVVIDLQSLYVCIGTLVRIDTHFVELKNADLHDLRDTETSREQYVEDSRVTGVKRNRRRVIVVRNDIVAVARLDDVIAE
jgi:small nuclear ribonucleoprotein (snRNP)-like protein